MEDPYEIAFLADAPPDPRTAIDRATAAGFAPGSDGPDVAEEFAVRTASGRLEQREPAPLDEALDAIVEADGSRITLWWAGDGALAVQLAFPPADDRVWNEPAFLVRFPSAALDPLDIAESAEVGREVARERVDAVVELVRSLIPAVDPVYGWAIPGGASADGYRPTDRPIAEHVEDLGWITLFSEDTVEDFGGRDRVQNAPGWHVEALDSGHVFLVTTDNPVDPHAGPVGSPERYLLEGASREELRSELQAGAHDPFLELEPGEYGADVVVAADALDGDTDNEDMELVRCRVGEDGCLREAESGEFVRRRFEDRSTPIGDLPAGTDTAAERYSLLILLGAPVEFVRLAEPTDENVVTRLLALDVNVHKGQLLNSLTEVLRSGESDVETIESALATVQEIDHRDGADQFVRERFL